MSITYRLYLPDNSHDYVRGTVFMPQVTASIGRLQHVSDMVVSYCEV